MADTKRYNLYVEDDSSVRFSDWRQKINGTENSNMTIIDKNLWEAYNAYAFVSDTLRVSEWNGDKAPFTCKHTLYSIGDYYDSENMIYRDKGFVILSDDASKVQRAVAQEAEITIGTQTRQEGSPHITVEFIANGKKPTADIPIRFIGFRNDANTPFICSIFPTGSLSNGIELAPVSNLTIVSSSGQAAITWTDPEDIVVSNATLAKWDGTLLVRKYGSPPLYYFDGDIIADSKVKNQYSSSAYIDTGLSVGTTYYYKLFPYTTKGIYTNDKSDEFTVFVPGASTVPDPAVSYDSFDGISLQTEASYVIPIAAAISDNAEITNETETVYYNDGVNHWKISIGDYVYASAGNGNDDSDWESNYSDCMFRIIGFNHDTLTDAKAYGKTTATGKAGITVQMDSLFPDGYPMNQSLENTGGWERSYMRSVLMANMYNYFPEGTQSCIKAVNKATSNADSNAATPLLVTSSDKCFLLSEVEVIGDSPYSLSGEGEIYKYYAMAGDHQIIEGDYDYWWLRSPVLGDNKSFCSVWTGNTGTTPNYANTEYGVVFAFCI